MYFFTLIQYKINVVVVVVVVCSFRARQPLLLLVTPLLNPLLLSNLVPRGFSVFKIAWLLA